MQAIVWEGFTGGCRPRRGGWGSDDNNYDSRGDDDVNNVRPCPPHATINLSDKEKRGTFRRGENLHDRHGEGEGKGKGKGNAADSRCLRRRGSKNNDDGGGGGGNGRRQGSGHRSHDDHDDGDDGDGGDDDLTECL